MLVIGENLAENLITNFTLLYTNIPGDDVFGFITINEGIKIHRLRVNLSERNTITIKTMHTVSWKQKESESGMISFFILSGIKITGIGWSGFGEQYYEDYFKRIECKYAFY